MRSPLFPWAGPRSHLCSQAQVKQAKQLDSVMPETLCSCRAQAKLLPGARDSSGSKMRRQLGSVCPGWKASAFPGHWGKERDLAGMGCEAGMRPAKRLPGHRTQGAKEQLYLQAVGAITELATRGQCFPGASRAKLRPQ